MRHSHGIQHAILGVLSRHPEGLHGYAVRRQAERLLGHFWRLNFGEVYRTLDRLASEGLIQHVAGGVESARKVYRITPRGECSLDDYVVTPQTDMPRPLRQELAVKLLFANRAHIPALLSLVARQRDAYLQELQELHTERRKIRRIPFDPFATNLLIDGAELAARAEVAWLEAVAKQLQNRYAEGAGAPIARNGSADR